MRTARSTRSVTRSVGLSPTDSNAVVVSGQSEAIVIDSGFTRANALRIAANVLGGGKTLKPIFISNADPDWPRPPRNDSARRVFQNRRWRPDPARRRGHPASAVKS
jgi:hypothetical protein